MGRSASEAERHNDTHLVVANCLAALQTVAPLSAARCSAKGERTGKPLEAVLLTSARGSRR
jgi:isopropylmalate/homocitrate/citramalate synthase